MRRLRSACSAVLFLLASVLAVSVSFADAGEEEARKLFKDGVGFLNRGSFAEALDRFERAYDLWHNPKILLNIATTLRELGRLPDAANAYQQYLKDSGADPERVPEVQKALAEIDPKVSVLQVEVKTPGASLSVHGTALRRESARTLRLVRTLGDEADASSTWTVRVVPGEHLISIAKEGFETHTEKVMLAAGEKRSLTIGLDPRGGHASGEPEPEPSETPEPSSEPEVLDLSHSGQVSLIARADVDGKFRGAVGVVGVGYGLGDVVELQVAALVGRDKGFEPGATLYLSTGVFKPLGYVGVPVFFVDGTSPGAHGALGLQVDPSRSLGIVGQVGAAAFFNVPEHRESTAFIVSLGVQGRL